MKQDWKVGLYQASAVVLAGFIVSCTPPSNHENLDGRRNGSTYYCPRSSLALGVSSGFVHGTTEPDSVDIERITLNMSRKGCGDETVYCERLEIQGQAELLIAVPKTLDKNTLSIEGETITWRPIFGASNQNALEFIVWEKDDAHGKKKYSYLVRNGRLDAFFGVNPLEPSNWDDGESCYLISGEGLLGNMEGLNVVK